MDYQTFFNELIRVLKNLPKKGNCYILHTLAENKKNLVKLEGNKILVATDRENYRVFKEIDTYDIRRTFKFLMDRKWHKQLALKEENKIKRISFILAAFSRLKYFEYNRDMNAMRMKKK